MKKIAIFASGSGTNFENITKNVKPLNIPCSIELLICDKPGAKVLERAEALQIDSLALSPKDFADKAAYEQEILCALQEKQVEFIVLAGYMRLIGHTLLAAYEGKIINIHPSLLPAFPGKDAIGQAFQAGVKVAGVTVHYVDEGMDTGPIIAQQAVQLEDDETRESLEEKIHQIEYELYPKTLVKLFS